jgi:trans-aconitate methyltransferase
VLIGPILTQSRCYSRRGFPFGGALLKHSLVPLALIRQSLPERGLVLDLGCGEGMLTNLIACQCPGLRLQGIDRDAAKIERANRNASRNASFAEGNILEEGLPSAQGVIANDVLHHFAPEPQEALLRNVASLLDDEGVFILKEVDASDYLDRRWTTFWDRRLYPDDALHFRPLAEWR